MKILFCLRVNRSFAWVKEAFIFGHEICSAGVRVSTFITDVLINVIIQFKLDVT